MSKQHLMLMNRFVGQSGERELFFKKISFINYTKNTNKQKNINTYKNTKEIDKFKIGKSKKWIGYIAEVKETIKRIKLLQDSLSFL